MAPENRPFTDPRTLLGYRKSGQPIYLVAGAEDAPADGPPADPPKPVEPPADPKPEPAPDATLGDAGKKAIDRERDALRSGRRTVLASFPRRDPGQRRLSQHPCPRDQRG